MDPIWRLYYQHATRASDLSAVAPTAGVAFVHCSGRKGDRAAKPKELEQPQLSLLGTISGDDDQFGIFVDQATKAVLRLRVGDEFQGWKLQSVSWREVAFQKNQQRFVVALPHRGLSQPSIVVREVPAAAPDTGLLPANVRRPGRH